MPTDKLEEAIAAGAAEFPAREEKRDLEAEAAEVIAKASLSTRDRILDFGATAVPGSLKALFVTALLQGMPEGVDEGEVSAFMDSLEGGETAGVGFLALARKIHFVELCLPDLRADFESGRCPRPKELTFSKIEEALFANHSEGLLKAAKLESAQFFEVDKAGNLVLSDGSDKVPQSTLGQNYPTVRAETHAAGLELFKRAEYGRFQSGERKYEFGFVFTWLENGKNPSYALIAYWNVAYVLVYEGNPYQGAVNRGARRLARIPLKGRM